MKSIFTSRKRSLGQGNIFTPVCHSVHRGGHAWPGGMHAWGHWVYMAGGHAYLGSMCGQGGVHGRGGACAGWGACVAGGCAWQMAGGVCVPGGPYPPSPILEHMVGQ